MKCHMHVVAQIKANKQQLEAEQIHLRRKPTGHDWHGWKRHSHLTLEGDEHWSSISGGEIRPVATVTHHQHRERTIMWSTVRVDSIVTPTGDLRPLHQHPTGFPVVSSCTKSHWSQWIYWATLTTESAHFAINNLSFRSNLAGDAGPTVRTWWTPCLICLLHHSLCSEGLSALGSLLFLLHCDGSPDPSGFCIYFNRTSWEFVRSSLRPPISHGSFPLGVNQQVLVA